MLRRPNHTVTQNPNGSLTVEGKCVVTGKPYSLTVVTSQFVAWQRGALIQDAFPNLTDDEREILKTGITPEGWAKMFPPGREE
jgi:hypothetical protein